MKKILFANVKGGVAKTTDVAMVAASLVRRGFKVLAIDGDPQGGLTECAGIIPVNRREDKNGVEYELMDVFDGKVSIKDAVIKTEMGDIIPNTFNLFVADKKYTGPSSFMMMARALREVEKDYDYCLIDALPGAGILLYNYLTAADFVVIPILAAKSSVRGISFLKSCIDDVKDSTNQKLSILGFVVNRYNKQTKFGVRIIGEIDEIVKALFNVGVFSTKIRNGVAVDESEYKGKSIFSHKPDSNVAKDFEKLTDEILERLGDAK